MSTADLIERALADLPATVRRRRGELSYRQAANESGVHYATFCKLEAGRMPKISAALLVKVLRWANQ